MAINKITIGDIIEASGTDRTRKLNTFLIGCTDRQRAFLLFYSDCPLVTPTEIALSPRHHKKVMKTIKDQNEFDKWDRLCDVMRDLWLKLLCTREQVGKILCYISAYLAKVDDAEAMAKTINKALEYVPEQDKWEVAIGMIRNFHQIFSIEGDTATVVLDINTKTYHVSVCDKDVHLLVDAAKEQYDWMQGEVKAFDVAFFQLRETIGEDAYWIMPKDMMSIINIFKNEDAFTICGTREKQKNIYPYLQPLYTIPMNTTSYNYIFDCLAEWM